MTTRRIWQINADIRAMQASFTEPDCCCCGDSLDHDAWGAGHTPMSLRAHLLMPLHEELFHAQQKADAAAKEYTPCF